MEEVWAKIINFPNYEVSNTGKVRSINYRNKGITNELKYSANWCGYKMVMLNNNGKPKNCTIHRLVAQAFIPNPNNYPQVNHKDENKQNNNVENLEWCTIKYNNNYNGRQQRIKHKTKSVEVYDLNNNKLNEFESITSAMKFYNDDASSIVKCCKGKIKKVNKKIYRYKGE